MGLCRHPDWSYFDHPPMIAWSIALGRLLLGDTRLGVRSVPLLFSLGTTWLLARMARRLYGDRAAQWAVLLYALIPAAFFVGAWGFPDSPLLFLWTLTLTWVWQALESRRPGWWLAAGFALGAGLLSKYTAAFLVPSVLLYLLRSKRDRHWLATPWPYLAGVFSLLVFAPVIYWNWTHEWASFRFQSLGRLEAAHSSSVRAALLSAAQQWLVVLPLTLPLAIVTVRRGATSARPAEQFLFCSFALTLAFFIPLGCTPSFHMLWPLPAYLGLTVSMAGAVVWRVDRLALVSGPGHRPDRHCGRHGGGGRIARRLGLPGDTAAAGKLWLGPGGQTRAGAERYLAWGQFLLGRGGPTLRHGQPVSFPTGNSFPGVRP